MTAATTSTPPPQPQQQQHQQQLAQQNGIQQTGFGHFMHPAQMMPVNMNYMGMMPPNMVQQQQARQHQPNGQVLYVNVPANPQHQPNMPKMQTAPMPTGQHQIPVPSNGQGQFFVSNGVVYQAPQTMMMSHPGAGFVFAQPPPTTASPNNNMAANIYMNTQQQQPTQSPTNAPINMNTTAKINNTNNSNIKMNVNAASLNPLGLLSNSALMVTKTERKVKGSSSHSPSPTPTDITGIEGTACAKYLVGKPPDFVQKELSQFTGTGAFSITELIVVLLFVHQAYRTRDPYASCYKRLEKKRSRTSIRQKVEKIVKQETGLLGGLLRDTTREIALDALWNRLQNIIVFASREGTGPEKSFIKALTKHYNDYLKEAEADYRTRQIDMSDPVKKQERVNIIEEANKSYLEQRRKEDGLKLQVKEEYQKTMTGIDEDLREAENNLRSNNVKPELKAVEVPPTPQQQGLNALIATAASMSQKLPVPKRTPSVNDKYNADNLPPPGSAASKNSALKRKKKAADRMSKPQYYSSATCSNFHIDLPENIRREIERANTTGEFSPAELSVTLLVAYHVFRLKIQHPYSVTVKLLGNRRTRSSVRQKLEKIVSQDNKSMKNMGVKVTDALYRRLQATLNVLKASPDKKMHEFVQAVVELGEYLDAQQWIVPDKKAKVNGTGYHRYVPIDDPNKNLSVMTNRAVKFPAFTPKSTNPKKKQKVSDYKAEVKPTTEESANLHLKVPLFIEEELNSYPGTGEFYVNELMVTLLLTHQMFAHKDPYAAVQTRMGTKRGRASIRQKVEKLIGQDTGIRGSILKHENMKNVKALLWLRFNKMLCNCEQYHSDKVKKFAAKLRAYASEYAESQGLTLR
mmetsp:Transcript_10135/g.13176  ORF Transcript_10135/g.13176 Transcript_10135/m.13176 type:complete len:859 (-) Transcript_10135:436-3012(-)|eukprot:CAMPEP_0204860588 /NCGR_PEP_ID=MMETSP1348-20121228/607_1 /ASSEMBLY_ACC=CAM_ASM_000700 /TAXON_ID=215587 /ORGANISM="Aplanochytrium stocchinoi, Strain GSBS06" /LENGTH=858 /DNA_ID=CAMNT_0052009365 /DNA_START=150 /DNA_END=2726 /DNA_ORIENTATION=-